MVYLNSNAFPTVMHPPVGGLSPHGVGLAEQEQCGGAAQVEVELLAGAHVVHRGRFVECLHVVAANK